MTTILTESKVCETPGCGAAAKLQCPTCIKLGIQGSYFCSQDCFKGSWKSHKVLHKLARNSRKDSTILVKDRLLLTTETHDEPFCGSSECLCEGLSPNDKEDYEPWPNYRFTGRLRPYPQGPKRTVPPHIPRPDYADHPEGVPLSEQAVRSSAQIRCLTDDEVEGMRLACKLGREVLDEAAAAIGIGVTTDEIDRVVHEACVERDCYPSPLNYYNFPRSCCTSINEVICHGIPDLRPLQDGDICNVDVTVYHRGFHGDLNETFLVGNVSPEAKKLVKVTSECLLRAINIVQPGEKYREVGNVIQKHAQAHGFSVVRSYCGHGIHKLFHTAPSIPHYAKNKAVGVMKPGHCFTIEPMISQGSWRDEMWPDKWTAVTVDGMLSAQFEHTLLVTENGCEVLTQRRERNGQFHFMDSAS